MSNNRQRNNTYRRARLIYMYICESERFDKTEINFTNDYEVKLNNSLTEISIEKKTNPPQYIENLYSSQISGVFAFVGKNGTGKTTVLNHMGMQDTTEEYYYKSQPYFLLYEVEGAFPFQCEIKGLKKDFPFINQELDRKEDCPFRVWRMAEYDQVKKKLITNFGREGEIILPYLQEEHDIFKFMYYRDQSAELTGWTHTYGKNDETSDETSTIERINIHNGLGDIYAFMCNKRDWIDKIISRDGDYTGKLTLHTGENALLHWEEYGSSEAKKAFIIQLLYILCKEEFDVWNSNLDAVKKELIIEDDRCLPEIKEYEKYKSIFIKAFTEKYEYKSEDLENIVKLLETLNYSYFEKDPNVYVRRGETSEITIHFSIFDNYNPKLKDVLNKLEEFQNGLVEARTPEGERRNILFDYEYDPLSAGEAKCVDIFSGVYRTIARDEKKARGKSFIILLDEPDKGMHPEMARNLMSILNAFSCELGAEYGISLQFIISTHSPFSVLDIPGVNVYRMDKKDNGKIYAERGRGGVMLNIVDQIKDSFYLKSIFGELCEAFFKKIQEEIAGIDKGASNESINPIQKKIELIEEKPLRDYLYSKLEEKMREKADRDELIAYYNDRIEELRKHD